MGIACFDQRKPVISEHSCSIQYSTSDGIPRAESVEIEFGWIGSSLILFMISMRRWWIGAVNNLERYIVWIMRSLDFTLIWDSAKTFKTCLPTFSGHRNYRNAIRESFRPHYDVNKWNSPVAGEFPTQRPVTRSFDVCFDPRLNKQLR